VKSDQRFFIKLAFNGKNYHGWQSQSNAISVQSVLNRTLSTLFRKKISAAGCGRTDTGVHAEKFYAHFDLGESDTALNKDKFIGKINSFLPKDIVITDILPVAPDANARFSALSRTYEYRITLVKNPFLEEFTYHYFGHLDIALMNEGAKILKHNIDFTSFSKLHSQTKTNICKIVEAAWQENNNLLVFKITADRFLRNMVRAIVGTLIDLGKGKINITDLEYIIESSSRNNAGTSVPAKGLFLIDVIYPSEIFL
jgi:tRNA pseudouridine38-40 synthase